MLKVVKLEHCNDPNAFGVQTKNDNAAFRQCLSLIDGVGHIMGHDGFYVVYPNEDCNRQDLIGRVEALEMPLGGVFASFYTQEDLLRALRMGYGEYLKLELGPGRIPVPLSHPSLGLTPSADPMADLWWDLNRGLPLPGNCLDEIVSNQTLEHIEKRNFIRLMNDFWRCLKPGGKMEHCVPHFLSSWADGDPTHFNRFSSESFRYFCTREDGTPFVDRFSDYGIKCAFILEKQVVRDGLDITVWMRKP